VICEPTALHLTAVVILHAALGGGAVMLGYWIGRQ
jgi:hypothetical protein